VCVCVCAWLHLYVCPVSFIMCLPYWRINVLINYTINAAAVSVCHDSLLYRNSLTYCGGFSHGRVS